MIQARSETLRLLMARRVDGIAQAADGADVDASGLELRAKARDVHFHRVRRKVLVPRRDGARDAVLADDRAQVGEEIGEDREFARRELEWRAVHRGALAVEIHGE